jgi:two-component system, chemotaxis family, sensor kinase CheA
VDQKKYRKLFLEEAKAHLEALDAEIVKLEKESSQTLIDSIFRHGHSIKGMAAAMGYEAIVQIAHALEDLMDSLRGGNRELTSGIIDALLAGRDALVDLVKSVEMDEPLVTKPALLDQLRPRFPTQPSASPSRTGLSQAPASSPALQAAAGPAPISMLQDGSMAPGKGGARCLVIRFSATASLPAARAFQATKLLAACALTFEPPVDDIRGGKFSGELKAYLSETLPADVEKKLRALPDVESVEVMTTAAQPPAAAARGAEGRHKLEVPSQIRIDTKVLDRFVDMVGELVTVNNQIREISRGLFSEDLMQSVEGLGRITGDLYQEVLQVRMVPFSLLADRLPRVTRDLAQRLNKELRLSLEGTEVEIDRSVMENLSDPLMHLVRNAIDHGIELPQVRRTAGKPPAGLLTIRARQSESSVLIEIEDDGAGIDRERVLSRAIEHRIVTEAQARKLTEHEVYELLFHAGFSTAESVSDVSGRGVGLDVVKTAIETVGGEILIRSTPGKGTRFRLRLPARVAIIPVFLVRAGEQTFGLPIAKVSRASWIRRNDIQINGGREALLVDQKVTAYYNLARLLGIQESFFEADDQMIFEFERDAGRILIGVDAFLEEREVYLKAAPRPLDRLRGLLGVTLVRGVPVYVLDPGMMVWNV